MAKQQQQMQSPGVFGWLMRYDSAYKSKFTFSPTTVVVYLVLIIVFVLILNIFFPVVIPFSGRGGGVWWILSNVQGALT